MIYMYISFGIFEKYSSDLNTCRCHRLDDFAPEVIVHQSDSKYLLDHLRSLFAFSSVIAF